MKMIQSRFRAAVLVGAAVSLLAFAVKANAQNQNSNNNQWPYGNPTPDNTWPYATIGRSPVLAVVGDVSCEPGETEPAGEKTGENCDSTKSPYTSTSLWQSQEATANEIETMKPDLVAILGDLQYQVGQYSDFEGSYDLTYGAFKMITRPAPGNHEFYDEHSATGVAGYGYFSYFNGYQINTSGAPVTATIPDPCPSGLVWTDPNPPAPASAPASPCGYPGATTANPQPVPRADGQAGHFEEPADGGVGVGDGWYSYNLGAWHLISLNIECSTQPGGCSNTGSWFASELEWLKKDLEANHSACTLAYWHQPTFSATNGITQEGVTAKAFWELLYQYHADLVLNGHDHLYARYRPLDPSGNYDPRRWHTPIHGGLRRRDTRSDRHNPCHVCRGFVHEFRNKPGGSQRQREFQRTESPGVYRGLLGRHGPDAQSQRLRVGLRVGTGRSYSCNQWSYISCTGRDWRL